MKKISINNKKWVFSKNIPQHFDVHILKSVPLYKESHDLILDLISFFSKENFIFYDIGCSTGSLLSKIQNKVIEKNSKYIGIDIEKSMIAYAKKKNKYKNISFIHADIAKYKLKKCDLVSSFYTLQFIEATKRQLVVNKIFDSLNINGSFILFEKVRASDAIFQDIAIANYNEFKIRNGFSKKEIFDKSRSLRGVLNPFTTKKNIAMLKKAGFANVEIVMKYNCFEGYLAIK